MSHDFARSHRLKKEAGGRKAPARKKKSGGVPFWVWLIVGTALGGLVMFLVYLSGLAPPPPGAAPSAPAAATSSQGAPEPAAPPKRVSPVFEFYTKLPEGGGQVTDIPPAAPAPGAPAVPPAAPAPATAPDAIQQLLDQQQAAASPAAAETAPKPEAAKPQPVKPEAAKTAAKGRFLQVGAFRGEAEVEKLRAKITLLGYRPSVQPVTNTKGETLQKVLVGPFRSDQEMSQAKAVLGGNGINSIPVK